MSTDSRTAAVDEIVYLRCEGCLGPRGATTMPLEEWPSRAKAHELWPSNIRQDGFSSWKQRSTGELSGWTSGRSGQLQRGPLRSGRPTGWERVERAGSWYLEWFKPCRCDRLARVREDKVRTWIREARRRTSGPVTIDIPTS